MIYYKISKDFFYISERKIGKDHKLGQWPCNTLYNPLYQDIVQRYPLNSCFFPAPIFKIKPLFFKLKAWLATPLCNPLPPLPLYYEFLKGFFNSGGVERWTADVVNTCNKDNMNQFNLSGKKYLKLLFAQWYFLVFIFQKVKDLIFLFFFVSHY